MPHTLTYKNSQLSYEVYGSGKELLLAFHGYGKEADSLKTLEEHCGDRFTIVSIDIPFHGNSTWNEQKNLTQQEWKSLITLLLEEFNNPKKFSVFGYSIGGQVATCTAWLFKERINTLWLMAATGVGNDGWYNLVVNTSIGRKLFKTFITKPGFFFFPFRLFSAIGVFTPALKTFVERKIDTQQKRAQLYLRWVVLRHFGIPINKFKKALNANDAKVLLVYGRGDKVVKSSGGRLFAKGINNATLLQPLIGHHLLTDKVLKNAVEHLK